MSSRKNKYQSLWLVAVGGCGFPKRLTERDQLNDNAGPSVHLADGLEYNKWVFDQIASKPKEVVRCIMVEPSLWRIVKSTEDMSSSC